MILDTSAIIAILFGEPERDDFLRKMNEAPVLGVGAPTLVETTLVWTGRTANSQDEVAGFVARLGLIVVPFERAHWHAAAQAWARFGRGRHPAALNLGDCFAYATARVAREPLLAKGDDFAQTDIALA